MQGTLRALVSRCVGASCAGTLPAHEAATRGALELANGFGGSGSDAAQRLSFSTAGLFNPSSAQGQARTPRSCLWLMQLTQAPGRDSLLPNTVRHYAKAAAKGGGGAAATAAAGPKRHRTSSTKLYSCRNDRLRHTHEQIWPTLQLTEVEAAMFRRNSRLFVIDMGRSISLQAKYRMGQFNPVQPAAPPEGPLDPAAAAAVAAARRKVPYQQARSLLHEPQLHLDALGENPRYLRVRKVGSLFATKMQNVRKLRLLLGFQRRKFVQGMYEHSLLATGSHRMWKMVCAMESKLAMFATRMGLAEDIVGGLRAVQHHKVYVNGVQPAMPYRGYLLPGDVVSPSAGSTSFFRNRIARSLQPLEADVIRSIM